MQLKKAWNEWRFQLNIPSGVYHTGSFNIMMFYIPTSTYPVCMQDLTSVENIYRHLDIDHWRNFRMVTDVCNLLTKSL